jgi:serine/threonine protein kinase
MPWEVPAQSLPEIAPGTELGNYRIVGKLDIDAGLSQSYLAEHKLFERRVTISHTSFGAGTRERFRQWLSRMERLRHPNIVGLLDCGEYAGYPYAVMQHVEGHTLSRVVRQGGPVDLLTALRLFSVLADVLAHSHEQRLAHVDLKNEHVIVGQDGKPYLKGFEGSRDLTASADSDPLVWTPGWCAPEIWRYKAAQATGTKPQVPDLASADCWSLGLMLFVALVGIEIKPDAFQDFEGARAYFTSDTPLDLSSLKLRAPDCIVHHVARCLSKSPSERYRDGIELRRGLSTAIAQVEGERGAGAPVHIASGSSLLLFVEPIGPTMAGRHLELRVTQRLGGGTFSDVFRVERDFLGHDRALALKVLKDDLATSTEVVERFRREALYLSRLEHPNVVRVHGFGGLGRTFFILEELVDGTTLEQWLASTPRRTLAR